MTQAAPGRSEREGISLVGLTRLFPNDAAAEAWFIKQRWPDGIHCHYCGSANVQTGAKHQTMPFRCRERTCAKRFSVRTGTVMQSSKLGFQVWAFAIYLLMTNLKGISSMKLHRELSITQRSAWYLAHRLRAAFAKSRGGTDHPENLQLLCGSCNRIKGNRPQEYLLARLQELGVTR